MEKLELHQFELKDRDLYLFGEIDNNMSFDFIKAVNVIIQKDKEICEENKKAIKTICEENTNNNEIKIPEVNIYLNSSGGFCYEGFAIYDAIQKLNNHCKVNIIITGMCMSMAIPIALSVPYEQRKCTQYTTFMIHQCSNLIVGKVAELEDGAKECKRLTNKVYDIILSNTAITKEELNDNYDKRTDWIIDTEQALKYKIVSEII